GYALRGIIAMQSRQLDRHPAALSDTLRAHEMNPNDPTVLRYLAILEAGLGEPERAIDHLHQALRLSPRQAHLYMFYQNIAYASFVARQYAEGIDWASRALNDKPAFLPAHVNLIECLVGAGEIDRARAAFLTGQEMAPSHLWSNLDGLPTSFRPEYRKRALIFLRIAAGLEDPSAAEALR